MEQGVLIGSDHSYERLLPWWHKHYQRHNDLPVAILDFGLSPWGKAQAQKIGEVIDATAFSGIELITEKCPIYGHIWEQIKEPCFKRLVNFQKSPFETTLWIDLDCQVNCSIKPLFAYANTNAKFAACRASQTNRAWQEMQNIIPQSVISYNGGVLVFKKDSPAIDLWIQALKNYLKPFYFDDVVFSIALAESSLQINEIPTIYNDDQESAKIIHRMGKGGKRKLFFDPLFRRERFEPFTDTNKAKDCGILIGCDQTQEQLLPFWYQNFRAFNDFPVAILDLGMSQEGRKRAEKIARIISVEQNYHTKPLTKIKNKSQRYFNQFVQKPCYIKTLNLHKTPFQNTIWLDTDTEVRGYLGHLFDMTNNASGFASNIFKNCVQKAAQKKGIISPNETYYSSMIAYTKDSPVIDAWQAITKKYRSLFRQ